MSVCTLKNHHDRDCHNGINHKGERNTWWVIGLTIVMMVAEISAGMVFGSMALLADGWHMGTHAAALGITVIAYWLARRHADNPQFVFGTGKIGVLGGYTSAIVLAIVALLMAAESVDRLIHPQPIQFNESILVAILGLTVNLLSAFILQGGHHHGHTHEKHHHHDHNLKAAYLHVLADALTSVLAIVALTTGKYFGWVWLDPVIGIVGAAVILKWSQGLLRDTSRILLDRNIDLDQVEALYQSLAQEDSDRVADLHVWQINPGQTAAVVRIDSTTPKSPDYYKNRLQHVAALDHITVEVNHCRPPAQSPGAWEASDLGLRRACREDRPILAVIWTDQHPGRRMGDSDHTGGGKPRRLPPFETAICSANRWVPFQCDGGYYIALNIACRHWIIAGRTWPPRRDRWKIDSKSWKSG